MEDKKSLSQNCGIRCRQIRMSKGISQQELADKMHVTAAAISKWEKEGISNIDVISELSNILGQDITADQIDQEGSIGEIGKEILTLLVKCNGYQDYSDLCSNMYGILRERCKVFETIVMISLHLLSHGLPAKSVNISG